MLKKIENYLKNRDLLSNIHNSKASFTQYVDDTWRKTKYRDYDFIACGADVYEQCREQLMLQAINNWRLRHGKKRTSKLREEDFDILTKEDYDNIDSKIVLFDDTLTDKLIGKMKLGYHNRVLYEEGKKRVPELPEDFDCDFEKLVLRVFTFSHIPDLEVINPRKNLKVSDRKEKVNFPPYKHVVFIDGRPNVVAYSHFDADWNFSNTNGKINDRLAMGFIKLCDRISTKYNWKGYSYVEDMRGNALVQLSTVGLQFNELFSSNPFSYYTSVINNAFTVIFNQEKDVQNGRDKILMENGQAPSSTRQYENENARSIYWDKEMGRDYMVASAVTHINPSEY